MKQKEMKAVDYFKGRYDRMRRFVDEYGIEGSQLALQQCVWAIEEEQKNKGGRPVEFGPTQLMEVWLYVEEAMARTGRTARAICLDRKAAYHLAHNSDDGIVVNSLKGTTLLRRYREAAALLKASSALYKNVPEGITIKIEGAPVQKMSPLEQHWRAQLEQRLTPKMVR